MARSVAPTAAMLRELRELRSPRRSGPRRGVLMVPVGTLEQWEEAARVQQAALIAATHEGVNDAPVVRILDPHQQLP